MTFTVTYRNATGALCEVCVEAASRTDCLAQMKTRGLAPVRVREGAAHRAEGGAGAKSPSVPSKALFAAVCALALAVGGGVWWWLRSGRVAEAPEGPPRKPAVAQPKPAKPAAVSVPTNAVAAVEATPPPVAAKPAPTGHVIKVGFTRQMVTLQDGTKVPANRPRFTNAIERAFSTLCNPGGMAIPFSVAMRRFSDQEIRRILAQPMVYDKNDSDELLERKFAIQQLKDQFRAYLDEGKSVQEAIAEIDANVRRESVCLNMARAGLAAALRTGDGETIRAYVAEQNVELEKRGMRKLTVPPRYQLQTTTQGELK